MDHDRNGHDPAPDGIAGLPLDEAVDAVVARDDDRTPETVRALLDRIAEDGVVSRAGVESALGHVATVVSTPETRAENASMALDDARETAEPVVHLDVVRSRLDAFTSRLAALDARVEDLGDDLQDLIARADDPDDLFAVARGIERLTREANAAQRTADDLALDVEAFEEWLRNPEHRHRELDGDADAMAGFVDDLAAATDDLAAAAEADDEGDDLGARWLDATAQHRMTGLLLDDLRAELADVRAWPAAGSDADAAAAAESDLPPAHGTGDEDRLDRIDERLDDLDAERDRIGERLDDRARPEWRERYDDRLATIERTLADFDPPVHWGDVQAALDDHRLGIGPDR